MRLLGISWVVMIFDEVVLRIFFLGVVNFEVLVVGLFGVWVLGVVFDVCFCIRCVWFGIRWLSVLIDFLE